MTVNYDDVLADLYFQRRLHEARRATDAPASVQLDLARSPLSDQHLVQATQTLGAPADDNRWGFSDVLHDVLSANPNSVPVGDLKQLQGNLQKQGYLPPDQPITGVWDDSFRAAFSRFDRDNFNDQLAGHHALSSPIEAGFRILNDTLPSKVYQGVIGAAKGIVAQTGETFSRGGLAGGALEGAAIGGALGSVVPGLGTAVGAAAGGVVGAVGGFLGSLFGHHESLVDSLSPIDDYAKEGPRAAFEDLGYVLSAASMIRGGGLAVQGAREGIAAFGAARAAQSAAGEEGGSLAAALAHAPTEAPGIVTKTIGRAVGLASKTASEKYIDFWKIHGLLSWQTAPLLRGVSGVYTGLSAGQLGARLASGVGSGDSATTIEKAIRDAPELPAYADLASFVLWPKQFFPIKLGSARAAAEAAMGDRSLQPYMHAGQQPAPDGSVLPLGQVKTRVLDAMGSSPAERQWSDTRLRLGYGIDRRVGEMKAELSRTGLELDDENVTAVLKADLVKRMRMEAAVQGKSPTATDLLRYALPDPTDSRNGPMAFADWLLSLPGEGSFVDRLPKFLQAERVAQQTSAGVRDGSIPGIVPGGGAIKTVDRAQLLRQRGQLSEMQREAKRLRGEAESLRVTDPVQSARTFSQAVQTEEAAQALQGEIKGAADAAGIRLTGAADVRPAAPAPPPEPTRVKIVGDIKPAPRAADVPEAQIAPVAPPVAAPEGAFQRGDIVTYLPDPAGRPERAWFVGPAAGKGRINVRTLDGRDLTVPAETLHAARPVEAPPGTFVVSDALVPRFQSIEQITSKVKPPPLEGGLPAEDFVRPNIDLAANRFHRYFGKELGYSRRQIEAVMRRAELLVVNAQRAGDQPDVMAVALRLLGFDGAQRSDAVGRFLGLRPIPLADRTAGIADDVLEAARRDLSLPPPQMLAREHPPEMVESALPPADIAPERGIPQREVGPVDLPEFDTLPPQEKSWTQNAEDGRVARPHSEQSPAPEDVPTGTVRGPRGFGHYSEIRTRNSWATLGSRVDVDGVPYVVDEIRGRFGAPGDRVMYGHPESGGPTQAIEPGRAANWRDTVAPKADKLIERITEADPRDQPVLDHIRAAKAEGKDVRAAYNEWEKRPLTGPGPTRPGSISLNRFERLWGVPEGQLTRPPSGVVDEGPHWVRVSVDGKEFKVLARGTGDTPNDFDQLAPETMTDPERLKAHAVDQWRQQQVGDAPAPELQIGPDQVEASSNADLARAVQEAGFKDIPEFRRAEELVNALKGRKAPSPELRDLQARVSQARNRLKTLTGTQKGHYTITPARPETPTAGDLHSLARQYTKLADKAFLLEHNARRAAGSDRELADVAKQAKLAQEALGSFVDDLTYKHLISREQGLRAKRVRSSAVADQLKRRAQFAARDVHLPDDVMRSFSDLGYKPVATGEEVLFSSELPRLLEPVGVGDYTRRAAFFDTLGLSPVVFSDRSLFALRGGHETAELDQVLQEHGIKVTGREARDRIYRTLRRRNSRAAYGPFVVDPEGKRRFFGVDVRDLKMDEISRAFEDISGFNDDTALAVYGALRRGAAFGSEATFRHPLDAARLLGRAMRVTGLQGFSDFIRGAHLSPKPTRQGIRLVGGAAAGAALGALEGDQPGDILKGALLGAGAATGLNLAARRTYGYLPDALVRANTALRYTLSFTFDAGRYSEQNMIAMIDANLPFIMRPQKYLERREGLHSIGLTDGVRAGEPISGRQAWDEAIRYFDRLNGVSYYSTAMDVDRRLFQAGILGFRPRDFETAQAYLLAQRGWDESKVEQTVAKMGRYGIGRSAAEKSANFVFFPFSFSKKLIATLGDFLLQAPGRNLLIHEGLRRYHQSTLDEKFHDLIQNHAPVLAQLWRVNNLAYGLSPGRFFLEGLNDDKTSVGKAAQILASIFIPSGAATPLAEAAGGTGDLAVHAFAPVVLAGHDVKGFADILDRYIPVVRDVRQYVQAGIEQKTSIAQGEVPYAQLADYSDARKAFKAQYSDMALMLGYSDVDSFLSSNIGAGPAAQLDTLDHRLADRYPTGFQMAQDFTNTEKLNDQLLYDIAQKSRRTAAEEEILKLAEIRESSKQLGELAGFDSNQSLGIAAREIRRRALAFGANDQFYSLYQQIFGTEFGPIRRTA